LGRGGAASAIAWTIGGGGISGTYSSGGPAPRQISGVKCFPYPSSFWKEKLIPLLRNAYAWVKDTSKNIVHTVGCSVNTLTREYQDAATDLVVKVPGGALSVGTSSTDRM